MDDNLTYTCKSYRNCIDNQKLHINCILHLAWKSLSHLLITSHPLKPNSPQHTRVLPRKKKKDDPLALLSINQASRLEINLSCNGHIAHSRLSYRILIPADQSPFERWSLGRFLSKQKYIVIIYCF